MITHITINNLSIIPKYKQIVDSVVHGIENSYIRYYDKLPSINEISCRYDVSRGTVEKAYRELKKLNIIDSIPGKGHFINVYGKQVSKKILLLLDRFDDQKKDIFHSLVSTLGVSTAVDFHLYNGDLDTFRSLIKDAVDKYSSLVIVPNFGKRQTEGMQLLRELPKEKLLLLIHSMQEANTLPAVVYNFEEDCLRILEAQKALIKKYKRINIVNRSQSIKSANILKAFQKFSIRHNISCYVFNDIRQLRISASELYVSFDDKDLLAIGKRIKASISDESALPGLLAFGDSPLKELLFGGISVVSYASTDFGKLAAHAIVEQTQETLYGSLQFKRRKTL
ncbi:MAG: winged helix-turn-helix domain-containing protein [Bacteroidota bacterium]